MGLRIADSESTPERSGPPSPKCEPVARIVDWLSLLASGPIVEMRATKVKRVGTDVVHTERAIYKTDREGLLRLAKDARMLSPRAEAVFITLNPLRGDLEGSASDADVTRRTWLLIDVDAIRPAGTSSTDEERQAAWQLATTVRQTLSEAGWPLPLVADSGNGWHLLYRIDLPADDGGLVARVLNALADRFDTPLAKIDRTVHNPSRICKLYGTLARKGEATAERPHRASAVYEAFSPMDLTPVAAMELVAADADKAPVKPTRKTRDGKRRGLIVRDLGPDPVEAYVATAIGTEMAIVASTPSGDRNNSFFRSACKTFEFVNTGKISESDAEAGLRDAGREAGLDDAEIAQAMRSARKRTEGKSRDLSHVGNKVGRPSTKSVVDPVTGAKEAADDERRLARIYLRKIRNHDDMTSLRWWNGEFHVWRQGAWRQRSDSEIQADVASVVKAELERHAVATDTVVGKVGTGLTANVVLALRSLTTLQLLDVPEQPAWLEVNGPDPAECMNFRNGIIHLPRLIASPGDADALIPPTPRYFSSNVLDYDFDPRPEQPARWLQFLAEVWPDDADSIVCLKQWFGYLLTTDTSRQKILLLLGPTRSGKGTISRILAAMLGVTNTAPVRLVSLGERFGAAALIGKSVAFCGESRITGRADTQAIVERLLSISGEDLQSIERKNLPDWHGRLTTRFILSANEMPRLGDYSDALPARLVVLKMSQSFEGREDTDLERKLRAEIPGILQWAIEGWDELREMGRFIATKGGADEVERFKEEMNPMGAFISEKIEIHADSEAEKKKLYDAWCDWCKERGRQHPGDDVHFFKGMRTALSKYSVSLHDFRRSDGGKQVRCIRGLRLRDEYEGAAY